MEVAANWKNKGIGLEIPATYTFYHKKPSKIKKLIELIRKKKIERICRCIDSVSVRIYNGYGGWLNRGSTVLRVDERKICFERKICN